MRFAPWIAVSACLAAFAWRVSETADEAEMGWWLFTRGSVLFAVLAAAIFCAVVAVFRLIRGARPGRQTRPTSGWAVALALLAAIPISFSYNDGCNDHWTFSAAAAVPLIAVAHPQTSVASYDDVSTLMLCFKPRERIPALTSHMRTTTSPRNSKAGTKRVHPQGFERPAPGTHEIGNSAVSWPLASPRSHRSTTAPAS